MKAMHPLDDFPLVRTESFEELRAALARIYVAPVLEPVDRDWRLRAVQNHRQLRQIGVSYGSYGTGVRFRFAEPKIVSQIFPIRGKAGLAVDASHVAIDPERTAVIDGTATAFDMVSDADYERLILLVDNDALTTKLTALLGDAVHASVRFALAQDPARPAARSLRDNFMFLVRQLNAGTPLPPLALAEFEQMLMVTFLYANANNYSRLLTQEPADVSSQQARRAEEFIEAHWHRPLNLETIASVTQASVRSVFRYLRRVRGHAALEFLTQVRLRRARAMLRRPEADTTVEGTAFVCGFADVECFAREYLRAFGEPPSATLARAGGFALH